MAAIDKGQPLTAEMIHGLVGGCLANRYDNTVATPDFHLELWKLCCSKDPLVAIAAPRMHGKSTAVSHAYVLASVLFRERQYVLLISDTESQAVNFLNDLKEELLNNDDIVELFGVKGFIKDSQTDIIVEMDDGHIFRIQTRGAEQRLRGLKWNQKRPDLIVCDDLEGDEQVQNRERREKFRRWFNAALIPCKAKHGIVRVVGTILHMDSLLNRLLPEDSHPATIIEPLKTWSTAKSAWRGIRYRAHDEGFKNLLWPEMYEPEFFKDKKEDLTNQGIPEVYAQEYLNYPIDESTAFFKRTDFLEIPKFQLDAILQNQIHVNYYAAVDFAVSTADRSDYTVITIAAVDSRGVVNIVDVRRGRWDSLQIIEEMFVVQQKYDPEIFVVERGAIEKAIGPVLRSEMLRRGHYLKLKPMTPTKDKQSRARGIQARIRAAGVKFDKGASWYMEFEDEMVRFPKARHDDQVDSISWLGLVLDEIQSGMSLEEEQEIEYQRSSKDALADGRSTTTGY